MRRNAGGIFALTALLLAAPSVAQTADAPSSFACPARARAMTRLELFFGAARKAGPPVSAEAWEAFVDAEIAPRFPDGLTWFEGRGQWRGASGETVRETTRMLVVYANAGAAAEDAVEAIRAAYRARFEQDSVMRVSGASCVAF